jgi:hypothetical protein
MALLPITMLDIITPYMVASEETITMVTAANRKQAVVRSLSHQFTMKLQLKPINVRTHSSRYYELITFLTKNSSFEVPIMNLFDNTVTGTITVSGSHVVGDDSISCNNSSLFQPGQFIRFSNKSKLYQVQYASGGLLYLSHGLRHAVPNATTITYADTYYDSTALNGVRATFINDDFGSVYGSIEDGVLGTFATLTLKEDL